MCTIIGLPDCHSPIIFLISIHDKMHLFVNLPEPILRAQKELLDKALGASVLMTKVEWPTAQLATEMPLAA